MCSLWGCVMIDDLLYFIKERHSIYLKKAEGLPKPWTEDKILQTYKFCNVYRELDAVTIWIRENIREPYENNHNLWFMLCIARQINWPDTLQELIEGGASWPVGKTWNWEKACEVMRVRQRKGEKVYTGAYMLRGDIQKVEGLNDKPLYTCCTVLQSVWRNRREISVKLNGTLETAFQAILGNPGWGSFLTAQVIADLKYAPQLDLAPDWWDWAASGPGSRRGLNRVLGREVDAPWKEEVWLSELQKLSKEVAPHLKKWKYPALHAQDLQSALCEVDKFLRVKNGEGRPRSLYPGV